MSVCMKKFYFHMKSLKSGFVANVKWRKELVLACCITYSLTVTIDIFSNLTVFLQVDSKEDGGSHEGELVLDVDDGSLFIVTEYGGDPELRYVCIQSNKAALYHKGM